MSYLDLRYAEAAIDIEFLEGMTISNSDFVYNDAAIDVEETAENEPILAALPCAPPYLSFVISSGNWFGELGVPAPSTDVSSVIGVAIPEEYESLFGAASSLASLSASFFGATNTIPFSIYSCPQIGIPPIPVTPVIITYIPLDPWFPNPEAE